jgi:hypothetical protein
MDSFRLIATAAVLAAGVFNASSAVTQDQLAAFSTIPLVPLVGFRVDSRGNVLGTTNDQISYLVMTVQDLLMFAEGGLRQFPIRPQSNALPDGIIETGEGGVVSSWLIEPTERYDHGILGDAIEAGGLGVEFPDGTIAEFRLDADHVFEDRRARIVDIDDDGIDELLVVRTNLQLGAALAVYDVLNGEVRERAVAEPIGQPYRWLNPVGVADFDGDGKLEIAAVVTPHLAGNLTIYRDSDGVLVPVAALEGYSNHAIGSREQGMAAIWDVNGDGADDIIVPSLDYRRVAIVSFAGGTPRELGWIEHDAIVVTNIVVGLVSGVRSGVYGLSDGTVVVLPLDGGAM